MLSFPPTVRVFICREPVDMRKSYDGLAGCAEQLLSADPLSVHLFVFFNRRATMVKFWYGIVPASVFTASGSNKAGLPTFMKTMVIRRQTLRDYF